MYVKYTNKIYYKKDIYIKMRYYLKKTVRLRLSETIYQLHFQRLNHRTM